jgi:hypothetical protein
LVQVFPARIGYDEGVCRKLPFKLKLARTLADLTGSERIEAAQ